MEKLDYQDVRWAVRRLPRALRELMQSEEWQGKVFVGGGYLRSIVANEPVNDVDVFVRSKEDGEKIAETLAGEVHGIFRSDNALTIKSRMPVQIIHRWLFEKAEDVSQSFDFTCCCAVIYYQNGKWDSYCDKRFYIDLAAKRLVYRTPDRNEDAGGSMLRVLKYYQKGYRIPLDSLGAVMARLVNGVRFDELPQQSDSGFEPQLGHLITTLLVEVDPAIDPAHLAHLPEQFSDDTEE